MQTVEVTKIAREIVGLALIIEGQTMDINEDINLAGNGGRYPAKPKKYKKSYKNLGPLNELLKKGLPDYVIDEILDVRRLAESMGEGISFQAVYSWFDRNRVSAKRVAQLVELSRATKVIPKPRFENGIEVKWQPLSRDDFWEFLG